MADGTFYGGSERCPKSRKVMMSEQQAIRGVERYARRWDAVMRAYQCRACGSWHIGHRGKHK